MSVVDYGFDPIRSKVKQRYWNTSLLRMQQYVVHVTVKTDWIRIRIMCPSGTTYLPVDWIRIRIMCPSGTTYLPVDCCFSELAL